MKEYTKEQLIDDIQFLCKEFDENEIKEGALKGEYNPTLAVEKMTELMTLLNEYKVINKISNK